MRTAIPIVLFLGGLCALAAEGPADSVYYLAPEGWREVTPTEGAGGRTVRLDPATLGAAGTALVLNKPEWMVLADDAPPAITGVRVDNRTLPPEAGRTLGAFWKLPDEIRIALSDKHNPLDERSLRVRIEGSGEGPDWEYLPLAGPAPQKGGELRVHLGELPPGTYELEVGIADRSPFAHVMTERLRLAVNGHRLSDDGQRLTLVAGGVEYVVRPDFERFLSIGDTGVHAYPTVQFRRPFYSLRKFTKVEAVVDEPAHQVIRVDALPGELNSERPSRHVALQFDFEIAGASKLLRVTTRVLNRSTSPGEVYCYWGWLPGSGYQLPGEEPETVEERPWAMRYQDIGVVDWLFLKPTKPALPGFGVVSPQPLGESRFGTLLIYASPKKSTVPRGGQVELVFGLLPASSAQEVTDARRQFERATRPAGGEDPTTTVPT